MKFNYFWYGFEFRVRCLALFFCFLLTFLAFYVFGVFLGFRDVGLMCYHILVLVILTICDLGGVVWRVFCVLWRYLALCALSCLCWHLLES